MEKAYSAVLKATQSSADELDKIRAKLARIESVISSGQSILSIVEDLRFLRNECALKISENEKLQMKVDEESEKLAHKYLDSMKLYNEWLAVVKEGGSGNMSS
ncbi:Hypothetical protein NTJ_10937 [Nesidiocoris tenuis]|uniref:Uncharacterized protein n=1 Tax=Nesidiocoris tenuis TaxID=355587 RepID=A0ABN7B5U1_9HEMI|nr:Hypothetical protein NTJ_10937 [Nesidiocoris tenuis]